VSHAKEAVEHALAIFDVCRINRNQLTHFMPSAGREGIEFWRNKGPRIEREIVPNDVADLRRVADEIRSLNNYLAGVGNHISGCRYRSPEIPLLPDKPPIPERLWRPRQAGQ
jgi:hypothetical protein